MDVKQIKQFSNLQTPYMYIVYLQPISGITTDIMSFTITARETAVPAKTRAKTDFRYLGRQMSFPQGISHEGEWTVTMVLDENATFYKDFVKWFYTVDGINMTVNNAYKTNAVIQLLNLDGTRTNSVYAMIGLYPTNIPNLDALNQETTDGHITFTANFGYDDVAHGTVTNNSISWIESATDIYFPYKDQLTNLKVLTVNS